MKRPLLLLSLFVPLAVGACRQQDASTPASMPIIDMHLHTLWWQAGITEPLTGFVGPNTPKEVRRRTIVELDRYHIVKAVASGEARGNHCAFCALRREIAMRLRLHSLIIAVARSQRISTPICCGSIRICRPAARGSSTRLWNS